MKKLLAMALALLMVAVLLPVTAMAEDGFVTVTIDYNSDYANENPNQITAAEDIINDMHYDTVKAAHDAFAALFAEGEPLFTNWNDPAKTVEKVTYSIYGTVAPGDANDISLSAGPRNKISVDLLGYNNARINGKVSFSAEVAGGYPTWTVKEGIFNVKNIEFMDNASLGVNGGMYNDDPTPTQDTINIEGCTFHGRLYTYHNDAAITRIENITGNKFINDGTVAYVFFHQGSDFRGTTNTVNFKNNTVTGYTRGINLQSNKTDFFVENNVISSTNSEPNRGAIQLTDAKKCVVTNNTIDVNGGNAIFFHEAATNMDVSYTISNNKIKAPYLVYNNVPNLPTENIQSEGNILTITYPGKAMTKENGVIEEETVISGTYSNSITIIVPDDTTDTTTTTEKPANPATGANDFVGVAAALAVVSLLGIAAITRKK